MSSVLVLDGAAGTYLETLGATSHPTLWSSGNLLTSQGQSLLREMHQVYMAAGADVITSTTYQASVPGLVATGLTVEESVELMTAGVVIAKEEAAKFASETSRRVLVAAGLGSYGAYLSQGEEYSGDYHEITYETLLEFWEPRIDAVLAAEPDVLLFETMPNYLELRVVFEKLLPKAQKRGIPVWVALSLQIPDSEAAGEITLADGTPLPQLGELIPARTPNCVIGANCFDVSRVIDALKALRPLDLPLLVYPNSGETYDGHEKTWAAPKHSVTESVWDPVAWRENGAVVIGGCCRTSPQTIAGLKAHLSN